MPKISMSEACGDWAMHMHDSADAGIYVETSVQQMSPEKKNGPEFSL